MILLRACFVSCVNLDLRGMRFKNWFCTIENFIENVSFIAFWLSVIVELRTTIKQFLLLRRQGNRSFCIRCKFCIYFLYMLNALSWLIFHVSHFHFMSMCVVPSLFYLLTFLLYLHVLYDSFTSLAPLLVSLTVYSIPI